ncbi:vitamin D3 receptor-like [Dreissena polymorpha]|uniref:Uncharacterized protein n=1 Tax=Dreissena polymorpha TaxID=45954 RepID=A0A9D4N4I9_DREPO|nr:vitamin D3 receptor-like [Dreissena polymorpha]KAH3886602.1 hypothetical protein DPMN_010613 [Dreissena polymorpha]
MDLLPLFDDNQAFDHAYHSMDTIMVSEDSILTADDSFIGLLADENDDELFGLSLLENNHDLIDIMAPLIDPTPFSPIPCDDFDVMNACNDTTSELAYERSSQRADVMSLRQLLQTKRSDSNKTTSSDAISIKPSKRCRRLKSNKTLNSDFVLPRRSSQMKVHHKPILLADVTSEIIPEKPASKALKFPPCAVCGGNASGLHYGVNSCEACKGFFRRFIIRNEEYKCTRGGNCKVVNKNRENCSGCRLKKCLELGMSKENSKLGRYSLSRRTETIKKVNVLEGKERNERGKKDAIKDVAGPFQFDHTYSGSKNNCNTLQDFIPDDMSPEAIIEELVSAMEEIKPYGPSIVTKSDIDTVIKYHHEKYKSKLQLYSEMKSIPRDECYKYLKDHGIDVDDRIKIFKEYVLKIKRISERYYSFAKTIPGFKKLESRDQSNLLNASRSDFFITLMHEGYDAECDIFLARNGVAYHVEEIADKFFSSSLIRHITNAYHRIQKLELTKEEKALLVSLTIVFTDRCKLENPEYVDKMRYIVSELIRFQLDRTVGKNAGRRFAKFVDCLVYLRDVTELYWREYKQLCKDDVIVEHVPMVKDFLADDW